jgi:murein L,D-transpeptidase YcbB/YkuD
MHGHRCADGRRLLRFLLPVLTACALARGSTSRADEAPTEGSALREIVSRGTLSELRWPDFSDYREHVESFYAPDGFAPQWVRDGGPSSQALALITAFRDAWQRGLAPDDYDAPRWDARLAELARAGGATEAEVARFDVALTVCAMRLVSDLHIGRINPRHFAFGLSVEGKKYDLPHLLHERLKSADDVAKVLDDVEPPFAGYHRARTALVRYTDLARQDTRETLAVPPKSLRVGQPYEGASRLRRLLTLVGDLAPDSTAPVDPGLYDAALAEGVKRFQSRHGLDADGRLGAATLKQLDVPLSRRVRQLQLALERWRWAPVEFSTPPIVVNIPDFRLRGLDESNRVALEMRVVVGKAMRNETPVFSDEMTYLVLRPYWNVPASIRRGEIVPAIETNRGYVASKRYEITTHDGKLVMDGTVSDEVLAQLKAGRLAVRQKPGPANSLGLVKLMFPNEFNVYLHDTPATTLFARSRRDFSHGCIRVEKPDELAAWVLRGDPAWPLERIREAMESGPDDVTVKLARPIPVLIVYATALADENGEVHFYEDIYGHDASLEQALARGYPYP